VAKVLFTVKLAPDEATLPVVQKRLGLADGDLDEEFGVVSIDPQRSLYTILVDEGAAAKLEGQEAVQGPYANPPIETFGPPS
jgi:hypothetical protein